MSSIALHPSDGAVVSSEQNQDHSFLRKPKVLRNYNDKYYRDAMDLIQALSFYAAAAAAACAAACSAGSGRGAAL